MKESEVEKYLKKRVEAAGGTCEKFVSPGKRGVPDRLITWGPLDKLGICPARIHFVETKAPNGKLSSAQKRDHKRREVMGVSVFVLWSNEWVDWYVSLFS